MKRKAAAAMLGLILAVTACSDRNAPTKVNFEAAIKRNIHLLDDLACLPTGKFPATLPRNLAGPFEVLVGAGLLARSESPKKDANFGFPQYDFELTQAGAASYREDIHAICAGKAELLEVVDFTKPTTTQGAETAAVDFAFHFVYVADWARSPEIAKEYPQVTMLLRNRTTDTWQLILKDSGWALNRDLRSYR